MSPRVWTIYAILQVLGEICSWTWPQASSFVGPYLWAGSALFLFPGNVASSWLIHTLLWTSSLSTLQLRLTQVPMEIAINAGMWLSVSCLWRVRKRSVGTTEKRDESS